MGRVSLARVVRLACLMGLWLDLPNDAGIGLNKHQNSPSDHHFDAQAVLSRTFGSAGEDGGVGVRFLMPILDMLNHGGDQTPLLLSDPPMAQDDVRCASTFFWCSMPTAVLAKRT